MLNGMKVKAFVVASNPQQAKDFYNGILDFKLLSEDGFGIEFAMKDASLRVSLVPDGQVQPQKHTVLGWCVPDITAALNYLKERGIVFEKYGFPDQDGDNIWTAPGGTKVAWFKDPFGNLLSIDQQG
jgi:catechol 2,3-dioxygenase-like lactoylglutathione lyase family enzyme